MKALHGQDKYNQNMKKIIRTLSLIALSLSVFLAASSCTKDKGPEQETFLEVNASNMAGSWKLFSINSEELMGGTYLHIDFVRNSRTYTLTTNLDSFGDGVHELTGGFSLYTDPASGTVIRGFYDHMDAASKDWNHRYVVSDLTEDSMVWTALEDASYVQVFHRATEE